MSKCPGGAKEYVSLVIMGTDIDQMNENKKELTTHYQYKY